MRTLMLALVPALALALAAPAQAEPSAFEEVSITVPFHDLDLSSPAGLTQLDRRIRSAARKVCSAGGRQPMRVAQLEQECIARAIQSGREQVAALVAGSEATRLVSR